jgi:hypothetical protein
MPGEIRIEWLDDSYSRLRKSLDRPIGNVFSPWWREVAGEALALAEAEAPVKTRELQRSHRVEIQNQFRIDIVNVAPYARFVHWGFRPHWMPPGILPFPAMRVIAERGYPGNPWITRALNRMDSRMPLLMEEFTRRYLIHWITTQG